MSQKQSDIQKWRDIMATLQTTWETNYGNMKYLHTKSAGVRSTQIGALVMMLIKMGIIK